MVMLRQAGAAGRSTTAIGGYGSPRSRGRQQWARRYSLTSSRTSERSERDPGPITTNGYFAPSRGRRTFNNSHRRLWVPPISGTTKWARSYSLTSSRPSERSERDPGPITTNGYVAPSGGRRPFNNSHRWLWVPAFAGTTTMGEALFPHVVPDK